MESSALLKPTVWGRQACIKAATPTIEFISGKYYEGNCKVTPRGRGWEVFAYKTGKLADTEGPLCPCKEREVLPRDRQQAHRLDSGLESGSTVPLTIHNTMSHQLSISDHSSLGRFPSHTDKETVTRLGQDSVGASTCLLWLWNA